MFKSRHQNGGILDDISDRLGVELFIVADMALDRDSMSTITGKGLRKAALGGGMGDRPDSVRRLSSCVRDMRSDIRETWRSRVRNDPDVPTAGLTDLELDDHVPELLEQIATALEEFATWRDDAAGRGEKAGSGPAAAKHVRLRARQGYDLSQVLRELHHLRGSIVDVCEEELVHFGGDAARVVHDAIDAAMTLAATNREPPAGG